MSTLLAGGYHLMDDEFEIVLDLVLNGPIEENHLNLASEALMSLLKLGVVQHKSNLVSFNLERYLIVSNSNWDPSE